MKLTSNTILITGGGSGIGYELTKQLTAFGNTILITGRDQSRMDRAKAAFPTIHTFRSDVSDPKAIATLYEQVTKQFPELNILINNAGIMRKINVHDKAGSLEDITREIEINLSGPIRMVKQFLPHLKTKSEASIMKVEEMVQVAVKGMQTNRFEIRPGQANQLKMMNRLAPGFILKQMSRSVDRMIRTQNKIRVMLRRLPITSIASAHYPTLEAIRVGSAAFRTGAARAVCSGPSREKMNDG